MKMNNNMNPVNVELFSKNLNLNSLIENHQGLVWVKDLEGRFVAVNSTFAKFFGLETNDIIGKTDYDFFSSDEADVYRSHDQRLIYSKTPFLIEEQLEFPERKIVTETYKAPFYNADNKVVGTIGFNRDITRHKKLELQNRKFMQAIEQSTAVIVITDTNGIIEYVNPQFTRLTGYTSFEAVGLNPKVLKSDFTPPETFANLWETISSGNQWQGELCNKTKGGEIFWESAVISPVFDDRGSIINYIAVKENITARKNAHDELIRLSKLQDLLVKLSLKNINIGFDEFDKNVYTSLQEISEFIHADRALIFKYNWDSNTCFCQYEWFGEVLESVKEQLIEVELSEITSWVENHKQGKSFQISDVDDYRGESSEIIKLRGIKSLISVPFFIGNECAGFISFDSIQKKHTYTSKENGLLEVFGQIYASLMQRFELEQTLKSESDKAIKANKAKSEFLANMSHELRTPLNGVIGFSELIMHSQINDVQMQYASAINTSAKSLLNVINDILDFSKIEAGKLELDIVKSDMIQLIEHSIDIVKHSAEKKKLELLLNIDTQLPRFAFVDSVRVSQIIINLLSNAIKFTGNGEVELKVEFKAIDNQKGEYIFSIRDTGIGISESEKLNLFKAFSQADSSTTRRFGGTGLGLSISEELAQKMGSTIRFESAIGEGSVFRFSIEVICENESVIYQEKIDTIKRVLVIDDNSNSRSNIQKMLQNWGIETVTCESASEAVFILQMTDNFDLIAVDNCVHKLSGIESIKLICNKLNVNIESQNFMLLHAVTDDYSFFVECEQMGIKYMIEKPLRYDEVYNYLKNINVEKVIQMADIQNDNTIEKMERTVKILVADDDVFNMMLAKAMIGNMVPGVEITEAVNGKIAYEKIIQNDFDIVFMDVQMPEMDGNEATMHVRSSESKIHKHTTIIGLTAGALKEEREKCLHAGMDDFLTKPIDTTKLKETIDRILNQ